MFVSVYYKLGLFNIHVRIIFVHIYLNVHTLRKPRIYTLGRAKTSYKRLLKYIPKKVYFSSRTVFLF